MKVKNDLPKLKKKKSKLETTTNSNIKKNRKRSKLKKVENNSEIADAVKKGLEESQKESGSKSPLKLQTWHAYLKIFLVSEKLNKKQKQIIEFCTSKSVTPPRRKQKFLNFVRNCYDKQSDITDELCNELFDLVLKKYDDYKAGKYSAPENMDALLTESLAPKPSKKKNKRKKLIRLASNDVENSSVDKTEKKEEKLEKTKSKKRKPQKQSSESEESDDDKMDE